MDSLSLLDMGPPSSLALQHRGFWFLGFRTFWTQTRTYTVSPLDAQAFRLGLNHTAGCPCTPAPDGTSRDSRPLTTAEADSHSKPLTSMSRSLSIHVLFILLPWRTLIQARERGNHFTAECQLISVKDDTAQKSSFCKHPSHN